MFKWRSEKNKITVVFKLQFHATQVSEFGGNALVLSLVPAENGKPTAKLEKCVMRENSCYWENPVFETVKFIQDLKTGKIQERIYYFIISAGSPKGCLVGEFSVNIADYAAASKACSISFPFKSNPHSHLHVSIQRIQETSSQRGLEEDEVPKINPDQKSLRRHFSDGVTEEGIKTSSVEDEPLRKTESLLPVVNGARRGSNGSDITLPSSDSSSGLDTPRELGARNNNTNSDQTLSGSNNQDQQRTQWELAIVPPNGSSTDYSLYSPSYAFSGERSQMGMDDSVEKLKADLVALSRRAEVSELELQTLRKQIVKESKKGQDLLRENTSLKEERDALKDECENLKAYQKRSEDMKVKNKLQFEGDPWALVDEIREELNHEKQLKSSLQLQLQKTQESNAELLLAVQDLEQMLEKNSRGISDLPNRSASGESAVEIEESMLRCQSDDDEEQKALEELVKQHSDAQESYLLEQKIMDLCSEIEMYRRDKDELEMQMEQLALDYEILKQENHEFSCRMEHSHLKEQLKVQYEYSSSHAVRSELEAQKEKLQSEIKEKSEEISCCLTTIKELEVRNKSLEENLKKQAERLTADKEAVNCALMEQEQRAAQAEAALTQSNATINQLETEIEKLKNELKKQLEELSGALATIKELETHSCSLEEELEKQAQGYKTDMDALLHAKMEQEGRAFLAEEAVISSKATINGLESHIKKLENELKKHSDESSHTLATVKELEAHLQNLEEELEKQAERFEADLGAVISAKVEQEKRAIQAEEALRLTRWKNANSVMRIQDEFRKLFTQMQVSLEASEKLAGKALTEASQLRLQNRHLQDMLQKANEDLQSATDDYETKLQELYNQINMKSTQTKQMVLETEEDAEQVENEKQHNGVQLSVSAENLKMRVEMERLISENKLLAVPAEQGGKLKSELEQMKAVAKERDLVVEGASASVNEVAGKSRGELYVLRHLKDEKEQVVITLESEVEALRAQCDNLKHSLYEDELEKEKLRKQVFHLKTDLKKKDEAISSMEKKSKENTGRVVAQERSRTASKNSKSESLRGSKEVITLKEKIKLLEGQIKLKEAAVETSTAAFLAKEKDLYDKIEELQTRLEELGQQSPDFGQDTMKEEKISVGMQVDCSADDITLAIDDELGDISNTTEDLNNTILADSDGKLLSSTQLIPSDHNSGGQQKFDILLKEMVLLKERNNYMEMELKEMQDRYSEISLKFAEVEGERQRLVMKLRNVKSSKKS